MRRLSRKQHRARPGRCGVPPRHSRIERAVARVVLVAFVTTGAAGPVGADPIPTAVGPAETSVGSGEFTINTPTHTEYTQHSDHAVIDWKEDLQQGPDHTLSFRQQQGFEVLNRSPGVHASNFYGTVTCDATCIFVNEAGVFFHDGSQIDVGRLIVAGGRITNDDFLTGRYVFQDVLGDVVNHGHMRGSDITLLGQRVANFGHVETPDGSFAMVAGTRIQLREHESPIVIESAIAPPAGSPFGDDPAVENGGTIDAGNGTVRLAAGDMLSFAIRQSGSIRANEIVLEGGDDGLVEVSGTLDASDPAPDGTGGRIDVLGDYVALTEGAVLDASGSAGGGKVRIGGDRLGEGETRTARGTYVHPDAVVRADAIHEGDGGEVIVFAEHLAQVYGHLSARGGTDGGDGGFVETSGKLGLDVRRAPEVGARSGAAGDRGGEWLIDPNNIEIVADSCGAAPQCLDNGLSQDSIQSPEFATTGPILLPTVDDSKISADLIASALEGGSNVTILTQTIADVQGTQVGDITVNAPIVLEEANSPGAGTQVTLSLRAAQDLVVNERIEVNRPLQPGEDRGPSDLQLDLLLVSADNDQFQAEAPADQVPNNFVGEIDLRADLDTAGGSITLQGFGLTTRPGTRITTNGGDIQVNAAVRDVVLRGDIDTSTDVLDELSGEVLRGGNLDIDSLAIRVPESGAADAPTNTSGGSIVFEGNVTTGGGLVDATSVGGTSLNSGVRVASTIDTGGGGLILRALEQTNQPVTSGDVAQTGGGRVTIEESARLLSNGGDIDIGVADPATLLPGAREIVMNGAIDSRVYTDDATPTLDATQRGGFVFLNTAGAGAKVVMGEGSTSGPSIRTNGGRVESFGDGSFQMKDGLIDATTQPSVTIPAEQAVSSQVFIQHGGSVTLESTTPSGGATASSIRANDSVTIIAGAGGVGDLTFDDAGGTNAGTHLAANNIALGAGDGASTSGSTGAQVLLGSTTFGFPDLGDPDVDTVLTLQQDADLATGAVAALLTDSQRNGLTTIGLASRDGTLDLSETTLLEADGLELELAAAKGVVVSAPGNPSPPAGALLDSLEIRVDEAFTVDRRLADFVTGTARDLLIAGGTPANAADPSLLVRDDGSLSGPLALGASDSLTLNGGRLGDGDLAFEGNVRLGAGDITLWAGNGDATGTAQIRSDGLANVKFVDGGGVNGLPNSFTLRQDAAIDDSIIPDPATQFSDAAGLPPASLAGVQYTLRADASGSSITLDSPGAARLRDTDLRLFANGGIDLTPLADRELVVRSLQIGGIGNFTYTADHNDKFRFSDQGASRELVIRAALGGSGVLSFGGGLTVEADEVRLVASDGVGGGTEGSINLAAVGGPAPVFRKDATSGLDGFVFRQDAAITETDLPDLDVHFAGLAPDQLAIRSDDGDIAFDSFAADPLLTAGSQLVLSAPVITFDRTDGADLVIDSIFDDGAGGTPASLQLRTDFVQWSATNPSLDLATDLAPEVRPGSTVRVAAFDRPDASESFESPPAAFDFGATIDAAPARLAITQDGDVLADNLIRLDQVGTGAPGTPLDLYAITSNYGSITIARDDVSVDILPADDTQPDLLLTLAGTDAGLGSRTIRLDDPLEKGFALNSLQAFAPFDWKVENATSGKSLRITATEFIDLFAGQSNSGNLSFGPNVTLRASDIGLKAGFDPSTLLAAGETAPADPDPASLPVVDTKGLTLEFEDTSALQTGTLLRIFQHGKFDDDPAAYDPAAGISEFMDASRITIIGDTRLDEIQYRSFSSDIEIDSWGNGVEHFPTRKLTFSAGSLNSSGEVVGGAISIGQRDGSDLNLSVDGAAIPNRIFEEFAIFGEDVHLSTTGGNGVIRARGPNLLFLDTIPVLPAEGDPPSFAIRFTQDAAGFDESSGASDCTSGCLPDSFQIFPNLALGTDYTIESLNGAIHFEDVLAAKVWGSNLTLLANDSAAPASPDIVFDLPTNRELDLFLESLTVGQAGTTSTDILLRADSSDAFDDLRILTAGAQTYNGAVTVDNPADGKIELVGDVVEFAGTIDKQVGSSADLVVGVVTEARFDGDIGATSRLDRLRLNFDPNATASSTARFGPESGSAATTVDADTIEFVAVSDAAADTQVPRAPVTSTIYKKGGDLTFRANTFTMGIGEKLSVQGDLVIDVGDATTTGTATLGDLSALNILVHSSAGATLPVIELQRRAPGTYLTRNGTLLPDSGVDYVANTIAFDGPIVLTGVGKDPVFGIAEPRNAPDFMQGFGILAAQENGATLTAADFDWTISSVLPDLHPEGASLDDPSSMYWAEDMVPQPPAWESEAWLPWQQSHLSDLFVFARPLDRREYASWLSGAAIIDDVGRDLQAWDGRPLPVAAQRLDGEEAKQAVLLFERIFSADGGNVPHLRRVLQRAVDEYVHHTGARRVVGFELRRYVKNRPSSLYQAHRLLDDLDSLFAYHRGLGLTPGEYRPIQARWLAAIRPEGITTRELAEAVQPSRYVRGSDVLDIFGD